MKEPVSKNKVKSNRRRYLWPAHTHKHKHTHSSMDTPSLKKPSPSENSHTQTCPFKEKMTRYENQNYQTIHAKNRNLVNMNLWTQMCGGSCVSPEGSYVKSWVTSLILLAETLIGGVYITGTSVRTLSGPNHVCGFHLPHYSPPWCEVLL